MIARIVIDEVRPSTPTRLYPAKAIAGEDAVVSADIFKEGHDILSARVRFRPDGRANWSSSPMSLEVNSRWFGTIVPQGLGLHEFIVDAWTDHYLTWRNHAIARYQAGQDLAVELDELLHLIDAHSKSLVGKPAEVLGKAREAAASKTVSPEERMNVGLSEAIRDVFANHPYRTDLSSSAPMLLWADRERALRSAWYELFPRSEGGLEAATKRLAAIAEMGFNVVYLPPIHPIGKSYRKGPNNTLDAGPDDPGSPWAIGGPEGGHTAIHPDLGDFEDFARFVDEAESLGMEVALDYALQCSPDHPWVKTHPEWFHRRPDGSIKYAENPPKKYQDIYPINLWADEGREELWNACKEILEFWIDKRIRIFRVDNPHTKPLAFWEWLLAEVKADHPDVIFLSEAFTAPKMMAKLAEVGFTQSYTYFTWRTAKWELTEYLTEIALGPKADYMRPNFWPNTPDILSGPLRNGGPGAFKQRLVLAATMVPSYGIYSGYELMENEPASDSNEEYLFSEKYEIKKRNWDVPWSLGPFVKQVNAIREAHPALLELTNIHFHHADNPNIIVYSKKKETDIVLVAVNLDPDRVQDSMLWLDMQALGIPPDTPFAAHDEISGSTFTWSGPRAYVKLDPFGDPAHILHLQR